MHVTVVSVQTNSHRAQLLTATQAYTQLALQLHFSQVNQIILLEPECKVSQ